MEIKKFTRKYNHLKEELQRMKDVVRYLEIKSPITNYALQEKVQSSHKCKHEEKMINSIEKAALYRFKIEQVERELEGIETALETFQKHQQEIIDYIGKDMSLAMIQRFTGLSKRKLDAEIEIIEQSLNYICLFS